VSISAQKNILMLFVTATAVLALVSCYTLYVYFGVASATRTMEVSLSDLEVFQTSDTKISVRTNLRIHNPSEFAFYVTWANEKLYNATNSKVIGKGNGYWLPPHAIPVEVHPFSNGTFAISADGLEVAKGRTYSLYLSVTIGLDTPLPSEVTLRLFEVVTFDT